MSKCSVCGKEIEFNEYLLPKGSQCCVCGDWFCHDCLKESTVEYDVQNLNYADMTNTVNVCNKCNKKYHKKFEQMEKITVNIYDKLSKLKNLYTIMRDTDV